MGIFSISNTVLVFAIICTCAGGQTPKISSSVMSHAGLSIGHRRRPTLDKTGSFYSSNSISPMFLKPTMTFTPTSSDQHFQWWDTSESPELVQSGWYGFNRFTPRKARHFDKTANRKARASLLLGESSQMQPQTSYRTPQQEPKQFDEDLAIHQVLRELQRHIRPLPQRDHYLEPQIVLINEAFGLPPGILVPMVPQPQHTNNIIRHSNYRRPPTDQRRLASSPTPVTIKVVPLQITSLDIANAFKSMSVVPIPLNYLNMGAKGSEANIEIIYDDKRSSDEDEEEDLPPPSSHVATPMDKPLGITYAEAQRTEHFISKYKPRN